METNEITEPEVLAFLKKELLKAQEKDRVLMIYAVNVKDIIKLIEHPEKCGKWLFDFVCYLFDAIKKIKKNYIIPNQKLENKIEKDAETD